MPSLTTGRIVGVATLLLLLTHVALAQEDRTGIQSVASRLAYGVGNRHHLTFASFVPRLSMFLPDFIDRPLAARHLQMEWVSEAIVSSITDGTTTVEAGINPLLFSLRYDRGQSLVPFVEGGEGLLYTDLRGERLGTRFQFSSQGGAGLHWFLNRQLSLTAAYRLRHISNAGISRENSGLNTDFVMVGVSYFPYR